jgi:hypothetical protein
MRTFRTRYTDMSKDEVYLKGDRWGISVKIEGDMKSE